MTPDDLNGQGFLHELYRQTSGDTAAQVSMYEVGSALGMAKSEAGSLAESLMVEGLVELKTLAGGIGITGEGLASLGMSASGHTAQGEIETFSTGPVTNEPDRQMINRIIGRIKEGITGQTITYDLLEEIIIDLKAVELHLLSPRPKVAVLRELFRSIHDALTAARLSTTANLLKTLIS